MNDAAIDPLEIPVEPRTLGAMLTRAAPPLVALVAVLVSAFASGTSEPSQWSIAAFALYCVAAIGALAGPFSGSGLDKLFAGGLLGLVAWAGVSLLWSDDHFRTVMEIERIAIYPAAALAILTISSRRSLGAVAIGVWGASALVAIYALATRLFPLRFGATNVPGVTGYRLAEPFPYWNMLAALTAIGIVLALGLAARSKTLTVRVPAAMSLVPLAVTIYYTYSRGAMAALVVAVLVAIAIDARRTQITTVVVALTIAPVIAIAVASRQKGLTDPGATLALAGHDGRFLGFVTIVISLAAALVMVIITGFEQRDPFSPRVARIWGIFLIVLVLVGAGAATVPYGGPVSAARKAYHSYTGGLDATGNDLNDRLFSLSSNGRRELWTAARSMVTSKPITGHGAGTFEGYWMAHRTTALDTENAHDLYLQILAELGPVGLILLLVVLAVPLVAVLRIRDEPFAAMTYGAFLVVVLQSLVDTNWQMPAVMIAAIACGAALVAAARFEDEGDLQGAGWRGRSLLAAVSVAAAVGVSYGLVVNRGIERAGSRVAAGNLCSAIDAAKTATRLAPWSASAWQARATVEALLGNTTVAAADYRKAIARSPTDYRLWLGLATVTPTAGRPAVLAGVRATNPRLDPALVPAVAPATPPVVCS